MSSVRAPRKYLALTLCFPVFNRFSSIPAYAESPIMKHVPFRKGLLSKTCLLFPKVIICRDIFCKFQLIVLHMMGLYSMDE